MAAFGAILAYEVGRKISASVGASEGPALVCVVSAEGPSWEGRKGEQHLLNGAGFEAMLREKGGTEPILEGGPDVKQMYPAAESRTRDWQPLVVADQQ